MIQMSLCRISGSTSATGAGKEEGKEIEIKNGITTSGSQKKKVKNREKNTGVY